MFELCNTLKGVLAIFILWLIHPVLGRRVVYVRSDQRLYHKGQQDKEVSYESSSDSSDNVGVS
jgi:hypothetical protein